MTFETLVAPGSVPFERPANTGFAEVLPDISAVAATVELELIAVEVAVGTTGTVAVDEAGAVDVEVVEAVEVVAVVEVVVEGFESCVRE